MDRKSILLFVMGLSLLFAGSILDPENEEKEKKIRFEFPLDRPLSELEKELRKYDVDWPVLEMKPGRKPVIEVEIDLEEREASLKIPKFLMKEPWIIVLSKWIGDYREKYGGIERMEREMMEYFKEVWKKWFREKEKGGE